MSFYNLSKEERTNVVIKISEGVLDDFNALQQKKIISYFSDEDTYIRKSAYLATGKIYFAHKKLGVKIINTLDDLVHTEDFKIRQTVINAAGEIGKKDFEMVQHFFDNGLFDNHHAVRNAVIGSVKKMGEVNPEPVLKWAQKYLRHTDKEIRREICHGIELRGRKFPQDILPLLKELQDDDTPRVRNTLIHVIGQISYKNGCLKTVIEDLRTWHNHRLVKDALEEIIDVHNRYKDFAVLTQDEARQYISDHFSP